MSLAGLALGWLRIAPLTVTPDWSWDVADRLSEDVEDGIRQPKVFGVQIEEAQCWATPRAIGVCWGGPCTVDVVW